MMLVPSLTVVPVALQSSKSQVEISVRPKFECQIFLNFGYAPGDNASNMWFFFLYRSANGFS